MLSRKVAKITVELSCPNGTATAEEMQTAIDEAYLVSLFVRTETGTERWDINSIVPDSITTVDDSESATADA